MALHRAWLRCRLPGLLAALTLLLVATAASAQVQPSDPPYVPGEVLIGWTPGSGPLPLVTPVKEGFESDRRDAAALAARGELASLTGLQVLSALPAHGVARLAVAEGREAEEIARLGALPWVRYAEPNYYAYAAVDAIYPNDPDFPRQWHAHRVAAPQAWAATPGSLSFVVAVLDTGVARSHPEFAFKLLAGKNYIDPALPPEDDDTQLSHGTHVTGIIAAGFDNGTGVSGLAPNIKILPLKVLNAQRVGAFGAITEAVYDAINLQAQVINLSLASTYHSQALEDALRYANLSGVLAVAAAGNCANDIYNCGSINPNMYPAAYDEVLAVAASDRFDRTTTYSSYKPYIDLAAPGGTNDQPVWSTTRTGYGPLSGTSMSAPMVSAAAALVWAMRPGAGPQEIADILMSTADKVGSSPYTGEPLSYATGRNDYFGTGRLNMGQAVRWAYPPSLTRVTERQSFLLGAPAMTQSRTIQLANPSSQGVIWQATVTSGADWLSVSPPSGASVFSTPASLALTASRGGLAPGMYWATVRVEPLYPAGLEGFDVTASLLIVSSLRSAHLPMAVNNAGPSWLDPDAPGVLYRSPLSLGNDVLQNVALPFGLAFYGATYGSLLVSDNGTVIFGSTGSANMRAPAFCPGNGMAPNNAVFVYAVDWDPALGGEIVVHQPNAETFVVTWQGMRRAASPLAQSFQLVVQSSGSMHANYRAVEGPTPGIIGTESFDAAFSQQVLCNGAGRQVRSGDTVHFVTHLPWMHP